MAQHVVLIDLENVQPKSLATLADKGCEVCVFIGANQTKLPVDFVADMQRMGERARYIRIAGSGPNALDFHIAFYIGQMSAKDPTASFHIISKDTGFDALIRHLKSRNINAARSASVGALPFVAAKKSKAKASASDARAKQFAEMLRAPKSSKPRTEETLAHHIATFFGSRLSEQEVSAVVAAMRKHGYIAIEDARVSYSLS